jgi:hypothetical protein
MCGIFLMDRNMAKNIEHNFHIKSPKIIRLDVSMNKYFVPLHTYMYMNMGSRSEPLWNTVRGNGCNFFCSLWPCTREGSVVCLPVH